MCIFTRTARDSRWSGGITAPAVNAGSWSPATLPTIPITDRGLCPAGITTQDPAIAKKLVVQQASIRVRNYLNTLTMEVQMLARACGKSDVHHLEREDLEALTLEASAMSKIPLAGTDWYPGKPGTTF